MIDPTYTGPERRAPVHDAIRAAVAEGIRDAVSDPALWDAAGKAMREQAQSAAGGWLLGGVHVLLARVTWVVAIMAGVYALGGWSALVAFVKSGAKP
jgi:hypothetical protein